MISILNLMKKSPVPVRVIGGPFKGAGLILNPTYSKRKIFGMYEHILNPWLYRVLRQVSVVYDVGANDGYFSYGCAHAIKKHLSRGYIVSFEPCMSEQAHLTTPATWSQYEGINFVFISKFVGAVNNDKIITLEETYNKRSMLHGMPSLIKVDVEGSELEVLKGAGPLLLNPHQWVVEVHGDHLLDPVLNIFEKAGRDVDIILPKPHWLLGPETRHIKTSWVTTK